MAGKLLLINPKRRRKATAKKRRSSRRRNPMPGAVAYFFAKKRRRHAAKRTHAHRRVRGVSQRRRNPLNVRGLVGQVVPMTVEAAVGAAGSIGLDYLWGQVNPYLPPTLQSKPGAVGVGDAVKIAATVAVGSLANRMTRGFAMRAARGALTVQMERIIKSFLPDAIKSQLAYAGPAPVVNGQWWSGPNRVMRGANLNALMRPGSRSPLLNGAMGALMRPGSASPLLSRAPQLGASAASGIRMRY